MKNNKTFILALVMLINALSYGVMIPLMYPYTTRFGMSPAMVGILFASYSFAQFIATPIIGRLSDKYGRKLLLLLSIFGTSVSLALFALAGSIPMLFVARILDGITGGNNSVAQAMIADTTSGSERAKAFGFLGAAFGFGFLIGPALGGLFGSFGLTYPFWFAAALALVATILGIFFLEETLTPSHRQSDKQPFFNIQAFISALKHPLVGGILLINLLSSTGHNTMIVGFQAFAFDILHMTTRDFGLLFTAFGVISIIVQMGGIALLLKIFKNPVTVLKLALILSSITTLILFSQTNYWVFIAASLLYATSLTPQGVMITSVISTRTTEEDQGGMLGINQAIMSLGQIIGPILASGVLIAGLHSVFLAATVLFGWGAYLALQQSKRLHTKVNI